MKEQTVNADKVIGNVEGVSIQANEVADATKVQANEVEQLARFTAEIDRVISLNVKDVERTCAVTKELSGYSEEIIETLQELAK